MEGCPAAGAGEAAVVPAAPAQLVRGTPVAAPGDASCQACGRPLRERTDVVACVSRPAHRDRFDVVRVYCDRTSCRPAVVGTLGYWDVLAAGTLVVQSTPEASHRLVLVEVGVERVSGPALGIEPTNVRPVSD